MTEREHAAFLAGIETARQMAVTAAVTIEVRDDARELRQQAAVAALQGLADGLRALTVEPAGEQGHCSSADLYNKPPTEAGHRVGP